MEIKAVRIHCIGKVQGVSFRAYTLKKCGELGLFGTVKNLRDGSVEIVAEGTDSQIDELLTWCDQGSPFSKVDFVHSAEIEVIGYKDFRILY